MILPKYIKRIKGIESKEEFKGTQKYTVKHFAFCYNSMCQIYKEAKYSISYWPKELKLNTFKRIKEED